MKVTDVLITPEEGADRLATACIKLDDIFVITDISIEESKDGIKYIQFPEGITEEGNVEEVCYPQTKALYEDISLAVLLAYEDYLAN